MKAPFDTNILVSAMIEAHPNHAISLPWIQRVRNKSISGYVSTHSIAELYAVITRYPIILDILIQTIRCFAKLRGRFKIHIFINIIYRTLKIYTC
jgi:predicted nucleic acid-binding protein